MEPDNQEILDEESAEVTPHDEVRKSFNPLWFLLIFFVFIGVVSYVFGFGTTPIIDKSRLEFNVTERLREIGHAQYEHSSHDEQRYYGTFEELQDKGYLHPSFTTGAAIEGYKLEWDIRYHNIPLNLGTSGQNQFTIVAYPVLTYSPALQTFGITDDHVIRVYNPENNNPFVSRDDPHVRSWDPIL